VILATESDTDSNAVQLYRSPFLQYPQADALLISEAKKIAHTQNISITTGSVFSTDLFYSEDPHRYESLIKKGVLAVDMETSMVYAMASYFSVRSISLLTGSDNIITGEALSAEDREKRTTDMIRLAMTLATS
jgi:purine-nucleoside phosphorylase